MRLMLSVTLEVAPVRERGLKYKCLAVASKRSWVAPVRERGLKLFGYDFRNDRRL